VTDKTGVTSVDVPVLHAAMRLRSPGLNAFAAGIAYLFGPVGMPVMALVAILLLALRRRSWTPVILIAAAGIGSLLMTIAGKDIIQRHRPNIALAIPPYEHSPSFPSGHTLNATVIAGIVGYLLWLRRHTIAAKVTALGAHWFTDVLAGWLLGLLWLALVVTAHRLYLTARQRGAPERPPLEGTARRAR
jgi:membrane-associated phospholipid phosphatase